MITVKGYTRIRRGKIERVDPTQREYSDQRGGQLSVEELRKRVVEVINQAVKDPDNKVLKLTAWDLIERFEHSYMKDGGTERDAKAEVNLIVMEAQKKETKEESKSYVLEERALRPKPQSWQEMGIIYEYLGVHKDKLRERKAEENALMMMSELARLHNIDLQKQSYRGQNLRIRAGRSGHTHAGAVYFEGASLIEFREDSYESLPHEFGHFLKDQIIPAEMVLKVVAQIRKTPEHLQLLEGLKKVRNSKKWIRYFDTPTEVWARAYEQWVFGRLPNDSPLKIAMSPYRDSRTDSVIFKESLPKVLFLVEEAVTYGIDVVQLEKALKTISGQAINELETKGYKVWTGMPIRKRPVWLGSLKTPEEAKKEKEFEDEVMRVTDTIWDYIGDHVDYVVLGKSLDEITNYVILEKAGMSGMPSMPGMHPGLVAVKVTVNGPSGPYQAIRWERPEDAQRMIKEGKAFGMQPQQEQGQQPEPPKPSVTVGEKINLGEKDVTVTAVGRDGVTARDEQGQRHQITHQNVQKEEGEKPKEEAKPETVFDEFEKWKETVPESKQNRLDFLKHLKSTNDPGYDEKRKALYDKTKEKEWKEGKTSEVKEVAKPEVKEEPKPEVKEEGEAKPKEAKPESEKSQTSVFDEFEKWSLSFKELSDEEIKELKRFGADEGDLNYYKENPKSGRYQIEKEKRREKEDEGIKITHEEFDTEKSLHSFFAKEEWNKVVKTLKKKDREDIEKVLLKNKVPVVLLGGLKNITISQNARISEPGEPDWITENVSSGYAAHAAGLYHRESAGIHIFLEQSGSSENKKSDFFGQVVIHELGHHVDMQGTGVSQDKYFSTAQIPQWEEFRKFQDDHTIKVGLRPYAAINTKEFFAEIFACAFQGDEEERRLLGDFLGLGEPINGENFTKKFMATRSSKGKGYSGKTERAKIEDRESYNPTPEDFEKERQARMKYNEEKAKKGNWKKYKSTESSKGKGYKLWEGKKYKSTEKEGSK